MKEKWRWCSAPLIGQSPRFLGRAARTAARCEQAKGGSSPAAIGAALRDLEPGAFGIGEPPFTFVQARKALPCSWIVGLTREPSFQIVSFAGGSRDRSGASRPFPGTDLGRHHVDGTDIGCERVDRAAAVLEQPAFLDVERRPLQIALGGFDLGQRVNPRIRWFSKEAEALTELETRQSPNRQRIDRDAKRLTGVGNASFLFEGQRFVESLARGFRAECRRGCRWRRWGSCARWRRGRGGRLCENAHLWLARNGGCKHGDERQSI